MNSEKGKIEPEILDRMTQAMDKVMLQFLEDNEIIFSDDIERKKLKYAHLKELKDWEKSNNCIFDGCKRKSIPKSHTIQKSTSLKLISENGHTMRPYFHPDKEKLSVELIGDNDASTFPGFCETHERLFEDFESKKTLTDAEHFKLQIYRTVCREIVRRQADIKGLETRLKQYLKHRETRIGELIQKELGKDFLANQDITFNATKFKSQDFRKKNLDDEIKKGKSDLDSFLKTFKRRISKDILKKKNARIFDSVVSLDICVPVALAGRGNFQLKKNEKVRNIDVIINVLPFANHTYVVVSGLITFKEQIEYYTKLWGDPLNFINMIESWMVHGSDHWFLKPSVWNQIKSIHQKKILTDIFDKSRNIGRPYELSIFNDIKRTLIGMLKDNFDELNYKQKELIEIEERKLSDDS